MEYNFREIEKKIRSYWRDEKVYASEAGGDKPKFYALSMFPYPSGAGLHVGHPLGYIANDIVARYKRNNGYNVLHPMGYDAFGLPAEQYAIQTGQHPAVTTEKNIARYREQLDRIGFSFDWEREVRTCDPQYYKWTQWIFLQLFDSWYNYRTQKAESIDTLTALFESEGYTGNDDRILTGNEEHNLAPFTAAEWKAFDEKKKADVLMNFRLAYLDEAWVNWCPGLGTVLANDEIKDGVSERGGFPVERKRMPQWSFRITAFADRLLADLDTIDWPESVKESQRNWIGRSEGASLFFQLDGHAEKIEVFTTRPDTVFGVTFVTLAPEHELVDKITTAEYREAVDAYVRTAKSKSERERQAEVKKVSGQFTGAYVLHPFTGAKVPVWTGDYVLAGYGTGAVMAVPAHDSRDYAFARHFNLPITEVVSGGNIEVESYDAKTGILVNSDFLNGLDVKPAVKRAIEEIEKRGLGKGKVNYRLRDAAFGRQRYWGEPIPIYYKNGIAHPLKESDLPLVLPEIEKFLPTETGEPPLARAEKWKWNESTRCVDSEGHPLETTTMPGWAGSSWYFLRYMDPNNGNAMVDKGVAEYWKNIDLYMGGAEHATGHLMYVRSWTKFLCDRGFIPVNEPAQKLINQGMIQGTSMIAHVSVDRTSEPEKYFMLPVDQPVVEGVSFHKNYLVNFVEFENGKYFITQEGGAKTREYEATFRNFYFEGDKRELLPAVEKMSKSKYNVVNPDDICDQYGADTLRLYEMFLGPLDQAKPWNTNGITGVHNFLKRFWRLFFNESGLAVTAEPATEAELKVLHRTVKKVRDDIDRYSFNTCVSTFMIAVNELTELKSRKRSVLEPLAVALSPFAPHIAEEIWQQLGHSGSITTAPYPVVDEKYLTDDTFEYPVQVNGKMRFKFPAPADMPPAEVEKAILASEEAQKWLEGKTPKKMVVVPKRIVNIVI
ncbi:MAG: leucine--tRNA ligase [Bacteroidetes bacterium]|nr:leucine--tRNA ligase [Bacteroidota bacterium]